MPGGFDIAVVISTRHRWPVLEGTLRALAEQALDGVSMQVVVADNWSRDGSRERVSELAASGSLPYALTVVCEPRRGPGPPRNTGVMAAEDADLLLFIGDDCRPARPDFIAGHVAAHRAGPGPWFAVQGHIDWDPDVGITPAMAWLAATDKMYAWERAETVPPGPYLFYTSNVSVPRATFLDVDGFDQRFDRYGWEDYEIGLRMQDRGLTLAYRPDLAVKHAHRYELGDSLRRMDSLGQTANLFHRLQPGRGGEEVPWPEGVKGWVARGLAPLAPAIGRVGTPLAFRASHIAALARGYGRPPIPDDPALRGHPVSRDPVPGRPPVSLILPFHGSVEEGRDVLARLDELRLGERDEVLVVDNTADGVLADESAPGVEILAAPARQSSYHARNRGCERARNDWLLFIDADCRPAPSLIDDYFRAGVVPDDVGAIAGPVVGDPDQSALVARYARQRRHLDQWLHLQWDPPFGITANMLVRRTAWLDVDGFAEGVRSGGDTDFSWRLQNAGWKLAYRHEAVVEHSHRESLRALARQQLRYGAGWRWLGTRHPGRYERPQIARPLARAAVGTVGWGLTLRGERAAFKALDGVTLVAGWAGWWWPNERAPARVTAPGPRGRAEPSGRAL